MNYFCEPSKGENEMWKSIKNDIIGSEGGIIL